MFCIYWAPDKYLNIPYERFDDKTALQSQNVVTAYLEKKQLLPFGVIITSYPFYRQINYNISWKRNLFVPNQHKLQILSGKLAKYEFSLPSGEVLGTLTLQVNYNQLANKIACEDSEIGII